MSKDSVAQRRSQLEELTDKSVRNPKGPDTQKFRTSLDAIFETIIAEMEKK